MKDKTKIKLSLLLLMLLWLPGCDNNIKSEPKQDTESKEYKEIYSLSDYSEETLSELDAAYERGRARYEMAQKKLQQADSVQQPQKIQKFRANGNAR